MSASGTMATPAQSRTPVTLTTSSNSVRRTASPVLEAEEEEVADEDEGEEADGEEDE